ncbi:MAG: hypothetical protein KKH04_11675 [Proteobacteria bacterium]|nr:hypothetical protein [Pseudomonadota bacterium]
MKIQMASPAPVPFDLWSVVGSTITAPTGQLKSGSPDALENAFVGGYDLAQPRNKREKARAIGNLKNMDFEVWIPSIADPGTRHWRYLFDVQQANAAFRLPLPTTSEFPGIETIQYQVKTASSDLPTSGLLIVGKIFTGTFSRATSKDREALKDFYLYVDDFQNLATPTFVSILSEARKYGLALTLTNQYTSQIKENILRGIQGNVGTLISFRVGANDADILSREFSKAISENDLIGLSNWHAYVRLLINGNVNSPFNMRTLLPEKKSRPEVVPQIWEYSRKHYARPLAEVEAEIQEAWIGKKEDEPKKGIQEKLFGENDKESEEREKVEEEDKENADE